MFIPKKNDEQNKLKQPEGEKYNLYGWERSYFTRKLEAALKFYGAAYEFLRKSKENGHEIQQRADTHQIPVLHTPENWMIADTTPIMMMLDRRFPGRYMFPEGELGVLVHILEEYFDEWIARTSVHWRWNYKENHELLSLDAASGDEEEAKQIASWGLRVCRATGVSSEIQKKEVENEYKRVLDAAEAQLNKTAYLLGDRPTAVDCIFLGGLRAHFNYDPAPRKVIHHAYPKTIEWCETLADQWDGRGDLAEFPDSTPFAQLILKEMVMTYQPFALGNQKALANQQKAFVIDMYGESVSYLARSYIERSRQMIIRRTQNNLTHEARERVHNWLHEIALANAFLS